ncbi:MAG: DUF2769 domain-containing protein [Candidatus Zixiibacteriota bacterium]
MAKVADTPENMQKCICGGCPSHNQCMKDNKQGLFCAVGKTDCELAKSGCLCGACPVASEHKLDKMYYCEIGAAE